MNFKISKGYIESFLLLTLLYIIYLLNYLHLKAENQHLYFGGFFDYNFNILNILLGYVLSVPILSYVLMQCNRSIFVMLLSVILIIGVLPGVILYVLSDNQSIYVFFLLYIYLIFILSLFTINKMSLSKKTKNINTEFNYYINLRILKIFGYIGLLFSIYLTIKYNYLMNFSGFETIYIQRNLFLNIVSTWEVYLIFFSKTIATFSFLIIAIRLKNRKYLFFLSIIYIVDYMLAAHKTSLFFLLFSLLHYSILSKIDLKKYYIRSVFFAIVVISLFLQYALFFSTTWLTRMISLYDRIFHVTAGLFARFFEYANEFYFFYGGSGLLGKIFSGINNGKSYTYEIGAYYFSDNVNANVDLIADGYINFGLIGSFFQLFILWLVFNNNDNKVFRDNYNILLPFLVLYSTKLHAMGLQTTLVTGSMIIFIIIIKIGFKKGYKK